MIETLSNFDNVSSVRDREDVLIDPTQNEKEMQVWTQRVTHNSNKEMARTKERDERKIRKNDERSKKQ